MQADVTVRLVMAAFPKNRIRELREGKEWEAFDLAYKLKCSASTVNRLEGGHIPSKYIQPLVDLFGVTSDFLLGIDRRDPGQLELGAAAEATA
jgi:hypothetical protein